MQSTTIEVAPARLANALKGRTTIVTACLASLVGSVFADMNEALIANPEFDGWVKARTPARRWGRPEELAGTAIYLASTASDYVNGQIMSVIM